MKILTLNTWQENGPWRERWEIIFSGLQQMKPDIAGFQEVFNAAWAAEIQKRTGYRTLVFSKEPGGLLILSRFPVTRTECLTLKTKSPSEDYFRYVLFAELQTEKKPLAVFNTHWSWQLLESSIRQKQAEEFLNFVSQKAGNGECVAMGDFNSTAWTPEIRKLKEAGFADTFAGLHPEKPGLTWDNANPDAFGSNHPMPDRRIDYIFFTPSPLSSPPSRGRGKGEGGILERPESAEVVFMKPDEQGRFASDHYGVFVTFKI